MLSGAALSLPAELRAAEPPELRGLRRDQVRLMVVNREARSITHTRFDQLGAFLRAGDLLVVNTTWTLPAALPARRQDGQLVQVRPCVRRGGQWDALVVEPAPPHRNVPLREGESLELADGIPALVEARRQDIPLLWRLRMPRVPMEAILASGQPIRYSYVPRPVPLAYYQTVFGSHPGSTEMASAGRPFTWELLLGLRRQGVRTTEIVLHTGLSSFQDDAFDAEHHMYEEWFEVGERAVRAILQAGRVIAVGTTVVRALETAALGTGRLRPIRGWTNLAIRPQSELRVVHGLLTGFHEPQASHFDLLRAFVDGPLLERAYDEAIGRRYLWHEFGDVTLIA